MCSVREKAFITVLANSGISADDAVLLNLEDLEGFQKREWVHIWMFRGKESVEEQVKAIEEIMEGMTPEQRELMQRHRITMREKAKKQAETETNGNGPADCQKIVAESELETYLNDGWHVAAVLPSGKIVIER